MKKLIWLAGLTLVGFSLKSLAASPRITEPPDAKPAQQEVTVIAIVKKSDNSGATIKLVKPKEDAVAQKSAASESARASETIYVRPELGSLASVNNTIIESLKGMQADECTASGVAKIVNEILALNNISTDSYVLDISGMGGSLDKCLVNN